MPKLPIDRKAFFDEVRKRLFRGRLSMGQVAGMNAVLDEWEKRGLDDNRCLAYMLATAYHETAKTMQAIREYGKGRGRKYGVKDKVTGHVYYGRGLVQLTWAENYKKMGKLLKLPLYENPDLALQLPVAVKIMFEGMLRAESFRGDFTGKALEDYFTPSKTDWINARRIINGLDKASLIASHARQFHEALVSATEPYKTPQTLTRSRTIVTAAATGAVGASTVAFDGYSLMETAQNANYYFTYGDFFGMAIGTVMIVGALYTAYVRWDMAGRPSFRQIVAGFGHQQE